MGDDVSSVQCPATISDDDALNGFPTSRPQDLQAVVPPALDAIPDASLALGFSHACEMEAIPNVIDSDFVCPLCLGACMLLGNAFLVPHRLQFLGVRYGSCWIVVRGPRHELAERHCVSTIALLVLR